MFEIRFDAMKVQTVCRRPFPVEVQNLGVWDDIQRLMSLITLLSNVVLLVFGTLGRGLSLGIQLALCLVMVVMAYCAREIVLWKFPEETEKTNLLKARMNFLEHKAVFSSFTDDDQQVYTEETDRLAGM
eukprot:Trichotokara_eunicae@DN3446_c0_g1_i2.p1